MASLTFGVVQAVNMSTILNQAKSLALIGSVISPFNLDLKCKYIVEQLSYVLQYMVHLSILVRLERISSISGANASQESHCRY